VRRPTTRIGTLPRVGAPGQLVDRVRTNPWLGVAIVAGVLLVIAWIAWAIHVWSDNGARSGIGVLIAWPALVIAAIVVALPLVGLFLWIRRSIGDSAADGSETESADEAEVTEPG
jgi:ABC-type sulfate transport system permease subunit